MGEIAVLGRLMGLFKHDMRAASVYILYIEFISLSLCNMLASFQTIW
jgi:hypothetical protein